MATDPSGFEIHRFIVRHPGSAVMMPVDDKDRVLLVKQFRLPAQRELWELPAGRLDPGESPLQAAKRELREETGYKAKKWVKLASFWATPGYVDEKMNLFLALDLTQVSRSQWMMSGLRSAGFQRPSWATSSGREKYWTEKR